MMRGSGATAERRLSVPEPIAPGSYRQGLPVVATGPSADFHHRWGHPRKASLAEENTSVDIEL
jgi:hypothetical protein